jgi:hypothetical protein
MKNALKLLVAAVVPAALIAVSVTAEAGPGKRGGRFLQKLVDVKALEASDLSGLDALKTSFKECRQQVKSGAQQKGACRGKGLELMKAKAGLLEKAVGKIQDEKLQRKVKRHLAKLNKRIAKISAKAAQ